MKFIPIILSENCILRLRKTELKSKSTALVTLITNNRIKERNEVLNQRIDNLRSIIYIKRGINMIKM